jgi:hypothetical protein
MNQVSRASEGRELIDAADAVAIGSDFAARATGALGGFGYFVRRPDSIWGGSL